MGNCTKLTKKTDFSTNNEKNTRELSKNKQSNASTNKKIGSEINLISNDHERKHNKKSIQGGSKVCFIRNLKGALLDHYDIISKLGDGSYGQVKLVLNRTTNIKRAAKTIILRSPGSNSDIIASEINILKRLDHPNIVRVFEVISNERSINIIMELCTGGELFERIKKMKRFTENIAATYIADIVSAIKYCHGLNIVHRDIKPENILFENQREDARLKIIDFGTSIVFKPREKLNTIIGTSFYVAPEVLKNNYDEKCDVWSIGVILYIMLSGVPPFHGPTDGAIYEKIKKLEINLRGEIWDKISDEAKNLVYKMLTKDPLFRPSIEEVYNDHWIQTRKNHSVPDIPIAMEALTNLSKFRLENSLKKIFLGYMISQFSTLEEIEELRKIFEEINKDSNGRLSKDEIKAGFDKYLGDTEIDFERLMRDCDADGNGYIDYSEFLTATINRHNYLSRERLLAAFNSCDLDHNGKISLQEMKAVLSEIGIDENRLREMIDEVDINHDGEIDFDEFKYFMNRTISSDMKFESPIKNLSPIL